MSEVWLSGKLNWKILKKDVNTRFFYKQQFSKEHEAETGKKSSKC